MEARRELNYPPYSQVVNLVISGEDEGDVVRRAELLAEAFARLADDGRVEVLGPAPAPIARLRRRHRWHLLVRGDRGEVQTAVSAALESLSERETEGLAVDVDPVSLM